MKKTLVKLSALCIMLAFNSLQAQEKIVQLEEVVITDSRFKIKRENSGKVVHKITSAEIENNLGKSVAKLINTVAGIEINGSKGVGGQNLGYFIRGGRSNEVVILIDGIQVIDPLQNSFDLNLLNLDQVASIEIIKGAASTLYGSGAATAVINITLKKAVKDSVNATLNSTVGTNRTTKSNSNLASFNSAINVNGSVNKFNYLVSFGHHYSEGISAAKPSEELTEKFEDDPFTRINTSINLGYEISDKFSVSTFGSFNKLNISFDGGSFFDAENISLNKNYRVGITPKYKYKNGDIQINMAYSLYDIDRTTSQYPGTSEGKNHVVDAFVKHNLNNTFYGILGVNAQKSEIETYSIAWGDTELSKTVYVEDPKTTIVDPYVNVVYVSQIGLNLNAGARLNTHSKYGNHVVYNFNPSYTMKHEGKGYSKIFASYSTAFVSPSLQDLYASWGNLDLKPQESLTYEGGIESKVYSFLLSATYFNREVENIIGYDDTLFKMVNKGAAVINGLEIEVSGDVLDDIGVRVNYTYTNNDNEAIRIPKNKLNATISYALNTITNFSLNYQFNDKRDETDFSSWPSTSVELESYSLLDFSANHQIVKNRMTLYASVTNILNENFEEVLGFSTRGRNYSLGFKFNF